MILEVLDLIEVEALCDQIVHAWTVRHRLLQLLRGWLPLSEISNLIMLPEVLHRPVGCLLPREVQELFVIGSHPVLANFRSEAIAHYSHVAATPHEAIFLVNKFLNLVLPKETFITELLPHSHVLKYVAYTLVLEQLAGAASLAWPIHTVSLSKAELALHGGNHIRVKVSLLMEVLNVSLKCFPSHVIKTHASFCFSILALLNVRRSGRRL